MSVDSRLEAVDRETLAPLVRQALGSDAAPVSDWCYERLTGGTVASVYRFRGPRPNAADWSLILKILRQWARPGDPDSWRRELLLYRSGLFDELPEGFGVPRCLGVAEPSPSEFWLWLEDVEGATGEEMSLDDHGQAARRLGQLQAPYLTGLPLPVYPWLTTERWLEYGSRHWGAGAIARLRQRVPDGLLRLWAERDRLLDAFGRLPLTLCHRDFNAGNLFVLDGRVVAIDWDCAGVGMIGEDLADLVCEALVYFGFDLRRAEGLAETAFASYVSGLREGGWLGDPALARTGFAVGSALAFSRRTHTLLRAPQPSSLRRLSCPLYP
ncbi:MAG: aminoglycoside phosphotransferase family protein [Myxococcota bacterium]